MWTRFQPNGRSQKCGRALTTRSRRCRFLCPTDRLPCELPLAGVVEIKIRENQPFADFYRRCEEDSSRMVGLKNPAARSRPRGDRQCRGEQTFNARITFRRKRRSPTPIAAPSKDRYSAVNPEALMTGAQRALSAAMIELSAAGVVPVGSTLKLSIRALISGVWSDVAWRPISMGRHDFLSWSAAPDRLGFKIERAYEPRTGQRRVTQRKFGALPALRGHRGERDEAPKA
jgi:hypothetical protein